MCWKTSSTVVCRRESERGEFNKEEGRSLPKAASAPSKRSMSGGMPGIADSPHRSPVGTRDTRSRMMHKRTSRYSSSVPSNPCVLACVRVCMLSVCACALYSSHHLHCSDRPPLLCSCAFRWWVCCRRMKNHSDLCSTCCIILR